jgi:hypothetical protein
MSEVDMNFPGAKDVDDAIGCLKQAVDILQATLNGQSDIGLEAALIEADEMIESTTDCLGYVRHRLFKDDDTPVRGATRGAENPASLSEAGIDKSSDFSFLDD